MFEIYAGATPIWFQGVTEKEYFITSPKFSEEVNKAGSLEFILPVTHKNYNDLQKMKTTIVIKENGVPVWRGRVLHDERDFFKNKHVYCEGQLSFLMDSVVRPYNSNYSVANTFRWYINQHNNQVERSRRFSVNENGGVTVTDPNDYLPRSSLVYPKTLDEMTEKLLNSLGGYFIPEWDSDKWWLNYWTSYGHTSDQVIRFGENLLDLSEYIDASNVITVLVPLGAKIGTTEERLTIASVNDGKDYIENQTAIDLFGRITESHEWDDVTDPSNLLAKGTSFLSSNIKMAVTLTIKAIDLNYLDVYADRIKLGDMVEVISEPHDLDTFVMCSGIVHDFDNPANTEYSFGTTLKSLTDAVSAIRGKR